MTASEWLGVMRQAKDFPKDLDRLIIAYGDMRVEEYKKKMEINGDVCPFCESNNITVFQYSCHECGCDTTNLKKI